MNIGDTLTCTIEKLVYGGNGLARVDGRVIFVPGSAPGEELRVRIRELKKSYAVADILDVSKPSPDRIEPDCRVAGPDGAGVRIPGCVYDHLSYAAEVRIKQLQLDEFMRGVAVPNSIPLKKSMDDTEVVPPVLFFAQFRRIWRVGLCRASA